MKTDISPEWIHIEVANHHFKYLISNPLHHSQEVVTFPQSPDTSELDYSNPYMWGEIKLKVEPNYEFLMTILKYNLWVRVIRPLHVKQYVKEHLELMMAYYK